MHYLPKILFEVFKVVCWSNMKWWKNPKISRKNAFLSSKRILQTIYKFNQISHLAECWRLWREAHTERGLKMPHSRHSPQAFFQVFRDNLLNLFSFSFPLIAIHPPASSSTKTFVSIKKINKRKCLVNISLGPSSSSSSPIHFDRDTFNPWVLSSSHHSVKIKTLLYQC